MNYANFKYKIWKGGHIFKNFAEKEQDGSVLMTVI